MPLEVARPPIKGICIPKTCQSQHQDLVELDEASRSRSPRIIFQLLKTSQLKLRSCLHTCDSCAGLSRLYGPCRVAPSRTLLGMFAPIQYLLDTVDGCAQPERLTLMRTDIEYRIMLLCGFRICRVHGQAVWDVGLTVFEVANQTGFFENLVHGTGFFSTGTHAGVSCLEGVLVSCLLERLYDKTLAGFGTCPLEYRVHAFRA